MGSWAKKSHPARDVALILRYCVGKVGPIIDTFLMPPRPYKELPPSPSPPCLCGAHRQVPPKGARKMRKFLPVTGPRSGFLSDRGDDQ